MSAKTNLALDLIIFAVFLVVASPSLTGNTIHEWLSVAFAAAIVTHLLFHWKWLVKVSALFFRKLFHQSRLNLVVDVLFFIAMTGSIFSGILISKDVLATFGIQLDGIGQGWKLIHSQTSDLSLILLGVHTALHWKWVVSMVKRYIMTPVRSLFRPASSRPLAAQTVRIESDK